MLHHKTFAITFLSVLPMIGQTAPSYYGTFGLGHTDQEPLNESRNFKNQHIKDTSSEAFALGAEFSSRWSTDLTATYSPFQGDDRVDIEQYTLNGSYFLTKTQTRPYAGLTIGYESIDVPDGISKETLTYGGHVGVHHDFTSRIFSRLEGQLLETRSTNIEHGSLMLEIGYRFGSGPSLNKSPIKVAEKTQPEKVETVAQNPAPVKSAEEINKLPAPAAGIADLDNDGVRDELDQCQHTEAGIKVDEQGCPTFSGTLSSIQFQSGSSNLTATSEEYLTSMAKELSRYPGLKIEILAHTDSQGSASFNQKLSTKRAEAVRQYLINQAIPPIKLTARGLGESQPVANNDTAVGRAKNRRVEFVVTNP